MSVEAADDAGLPMATRSRMLVVAMDLFSQNGFAGTSLQMIADELNLTKAAIYYHFRTRDDLLLALMQPMFIEIGRVVSAAERKRGARARAEAMLNGYADVVSRNRRLTAVTVFDPSVASALRHRPEWTALIERQLALLVNAGSPGSGAVNAAVVMTGLAGAASTANADVPDETLHAELLDVGRRILGLPISHNDHTTP